MRFGAMRPARTMMAPRLVHVWVSRGAGAVHEWVDYFNVDEHGSASGFCVDAGLRWFDIDQLVHVDAGRLVSVDEVVDEVPFSSDFEDDLIAACHRLGIIRVRHVVALLDDDRATEIRAEAGITTGDHELTYVGCFDLTCQRPGL